MNKLTNPQLKVLIIDNQSSYLRQLQDWLAGHKLTVLGLGEVVPRDADDHDLVVLSGGRALNAVWDAAAFTRELSLVDETHKPIIGICLGFELLARHFGGTLKRLEAKVKGEMTLQSVIQDPIMQGLDEMKVFESHRWVVDYLPGTLLEVARSKDGVEVFRHVSRPVYGFQFHPEIIVDESQSATFRDNLVRFVKPAK